MDKSIRLRPLFSVLIIAILVIIDQLSKYIMLVNLSDAPMGVSVINGVFSLIYVENTGISFSMFSGKMIFIIIVTLVILLLLVYVLIRTPKTRYFLPFSITLSVIIAGAVGNLIDRIIRGYVIDFISLDFIGFPIFNFADICVCVGLFILVLLIFIRYKDNDFGFIIRKGKEVGRDNDKL